jgi:hypothetical protein
VRLEICLHFQQVAAVLLLDLGKLLLTAGELDLRLALVSLREKGMRLRRRAQSELWMEEAKRAVCGECIQPSDLFLMLAQPHPSPAHHLGGLELRAQLLAVGLDFKQPEREELHACMSVEQEG